MEMQHSGNTVRSTGSKASPPAARGVGLVRTGSVVSGLAVDTQQPAHRSPLAFLDSPTAATLDGSADATRVSNPATTTTTTTPPPRRFVRAPTPHARKLQRLRQGIGHTHDNDGGAGTAVDTGGGVGDHGTTTTHEQGVGDDGNDNKGGVGDDAVAPLGGLARVPATPSTRTAMLAAAQAIAERASTALVDAALLVDGACGATGDDAHANATVPLASEQAPPRTPSDLARHAREQAREELRRTLQVLTFGGAKAGGGGGGGGDGGDGVGGDGTRGAGAGAPGGRAWTARAVLPSQRWSMHSAGDVAQAADALRILFAGTGAGGEDHHRGGGGGRDDGVVGDGRGDGDGDGDGDVATGVTKAPKNGDIAPLVSSTTAATATATATAAAATPPSVHMHPSTQGHLTDEVRSVAGDMVSHTADATPLSHAAGVLLAQRLGLGGAMDVYHPPECPASRGGPCVAHAASKVVAATSSTTTTTTSQQRDASAAVGAAGTLVDAEVASVFTQPRAVLCVFGGAGGLHSVLMPKLQSLVGRGAVGAAAQAGALVLTGGTESGMMKMVGSALSRGGAAPHTLPLLGCCPRGAL